MLVVILRVHASNGLGYAAYFQYRQSMAKRIVGNSGHRRTRFCLRKPFEATTNASSAYCQITLRGKRTHRVTVFARFPRGIAVRKQQTQ